MTPLKQEMATSLNEDILSAVNEPDQTSDALHGGEPPSPLSPAPQDILRSESATPSAQRAKPQMREDCQSRVGIWIHGVDRCDQDAFHDGQTKGEKTQKTKLTPLHPASTGMQLGHSESDRSWIALADIEKDHPNKRGLEAYDATSEKRVNSIEESSDYKADQEIATLARTLSQQSAWTQMPSNPFQAEKYSELDPNGPNFKARSWVKSMMKLYREDGRNPVRSGGVAFRNLSVYGFGATTDYQKNVSNIWLGGVGYVKKILGISKPRRIDILHDLEGLVRSGETLIVLGPPGSGCSTFLKSVTGDTHGIEIEDSSYVNYQGIPANHMHKYFRGEAIYTAEVDVHFPILSVGDTLTFAARARAPRQVPGGVTKHMFANQLRDAVMATFGISHTVNTRVGDEFTRGVSGGERKRVTIAEAALSGAPLQAWDNSTLGLDSANAIEFCKAVRLSAELAGSAAMVAIYQAPQAAYDQFDKAIVLYEGRQIFFGQCDQAKAYFEHMGFSCPERQTIADFLTSMTSPRERLIKPGYENRVPRTSEEFASVWENSLERAQLLRNIKAYEKQFPFEGESYQHFVESRQAQKSKQQRFKSPYTMSYIQQVNLCLWRGFRRLVSAPELTLTQLFGNFAMALILGSVFFNMRLDTDSFFRRGSVIFFSVLVNAFGCALEILTLYAQRPIVEKHDRYALYHPSAEAFASMLTDMPYKILNALVFNTTIYFMVNLRREADAFFFFLLVTFLTTVTMSMLFRTIASVSRTLSQAVAPAAIIILAVATFTGFTIPTNYMLGWCRWINYVDPIAYGFESLLINEFAGRDYTCNLASLVPPFGNLSDQSQVCSAIGSRPGEDFVAGTSYIESAYRYVPSHRWRNIAIIVALGVFFMFTYLAATEFISAKKPRGEVLIFQRGHVPAALKEKTKDEESIEAIHNESNARARKDSYVNPNNILKQTAIFSWKDVCYDVKIKGEKRRILDHVDGWVKPGTLTALMGVSGAGKTSLLDVLATRVTTSVISGEMLVDGRQCDSSFQRKTGYVQQHSHHLQTSTVREALNFSALLRQPKSTPNKEKLAYVDEVIDLLDMEVFADAVVGVPGEGLNVEQRKRLTIGVELAAKPELLLFLDEPTTGLDSQSSWAICDLLERLKNSGQAILCTIHQPSAMLFQRFDRLLFLAEGGKTVYFGEVGKNSRTLADYFERNGGPKCPKVANPAEWMLEVIGAAPGTHTDKDWFEIWRSSPEYQAVQQHLEQLKNKRPRQTTSLTMPTDIESYYEFAAPLTQQLREVTLRVFQQYWRTPSYIYSKIALCLCSALFTGLVFYDARLTHQGLQNQMFSIFMTFTIFSQLAQQIMPHFVTQRSLYEARERPSKAYSWQAFIISNIVVELPWNLLMAVVMFFCYYYPVGLYKNAGADLYERGALFFLFMVEFLLFTSSFTNMIIAGIDSAETGSSIANLMFTLCLVFCGVLATPETIPGFWIFMYRISPFTYLVGGFLSTGLANTDVYCADNEFVTVEPPGNKTCISYMQEYIDMDGGYLSNNDATSGCQYCAYGNSNVFLSSVNVSYSDRWQSFGILWCFIIVNICAAVFFYWLMRVPKNQGRRGTKRSN